MWKGVLFYLSRKFIVERKPINSLDQSINYNNQQLTVKQAFELFVNAKKAENVRERTIHDYGVHIKYLINFINEKYGGITYINELTTDIIRNYINYLRFEHKPYKDNKQRRIEEPGLSITTINIRLRTLRTMCRFWHKEGILSKNLMENIKPLKQDTDDSVNGFKMYEIKALFSVLNERNFSHWRDKVLMLLLLDTGLRINEATTLKYSDLDFKLNTLTVRKEISKNRKTRVIPISSKVLKLLAKLHEESKQYFGDDLDRIFINAYGKPYHASVFRRRLWNYAKKAGIDNATPHMFRHTFCRDYILNGGDIFTLQRIVGHESIATTRKYIQVDQNDINKQHSKSTPISKYEKYFN